MAKADDDLKKFLGECSAEECMSVLSTLKSSFSSKSHELLTSYPSVDHIPAIGTLSRDVLALQIVDHLRWFGSDGIAYKFRSIIGNEPGVHYSAILRDVVVLLNKRMDKKTRIEIPKAASVEELEEILVGIILRLAFKDKTNDEIAATMEEAGLEQDAAAIVAKQFGPGIAIGPLLQLLVAALGKKTVRNIVEMVAVSLVGKIIGREAASAMAKRMLIQVTQKALTRWIAIVGWGLTALDVLLFVSSPARRITVPCVSLIAAYRVKARFQVSIPSIAASSAATGA